MDNWLLFPIFVNFSQSLNVLIKFVTFSVFKFVPVPREVISLQLLKVWSIFTTFAVFNPVKSKIFNLSQLLNI